jgi:deoxyhypusine synthase
LAPHRAALAPRSPLGVAPAPPLPQLAWRLSDEPVAEGTDPEQADPAFRQSVRAKIFLGYTSNLISAGVREQVR